MAETHIRLTTLNGYEFFLTVGRDIELDVDIDMRQIPCGQYAVLRFKNPDNIGNAWEHLWSWIRENKYEYIGCRKATMVGVMDSRSK
ncbi:MAG: GyrI-like domain-containing protein [Candidatus Methanoperedens sp.]